MGPAAAQHRLRDTVPVKSARSSPLPVRELSTATVNREWESALPGENGADLPSVHQFARQAVHAKVRKLIYAGKLEDVAECCRPTGRNRSAGFERVGVGVVGAERRKVVHLFRPGVVRQHRQPIAQPLLHGELQAIVVGVDRANRSRSRSRSPGICAAPARWPPSILASRLDCFREYKLRD